MYYYGKRQTFYAPSLHKLFQSCSIHLCITPIQANTNYERHKYDIDTTILMSSRYSVKELYTL